MSTRSAVLCASAASAALRGGRAFGVRNAIRSMSTEASGSGSRDSLKGLLMDSIRASGPLTIPAYMQACLMNPEYGYYAGKYGLDGQPKREVLGARGDFITSPEISQVFGELLGVFFVSRWQQSGEPDKIRLIELGPGRGTLLCDMLRTFANFPKLFSSLRTIQMVEASPMLLMEQEKVLSSTLERYGKKLVSAEKPVEQLAPNEVRAEWFPSYHNVPVDPTYWTLVTAHEFFDALPIHIFERRLEGWREVMVDVTDFGTRTGGVTTYKASELLAGKQKQQEQEAGLRFVLSPQATPWTKLLVLQNDRFDGVQPGQRVEVSPLSWTIARRMGEWISGYEALKATPDNRVAPLSPEEEQRRAAPSRGGCGLVVDYGDAHWFSESFRAFRAHKIVDPLEYPGSSDLTANVDFQYLNNAVASTDARGYGLLSQRDLLMLLGLQLRVQKLVEQNPGRAQEIEGAAKRLVDSSSMGTQYKVLCVSAPSVPHAGIEPNEEIYPFL